MNHENSHQCSVCESLPATKTYSHTNNKKVKEKQREGGEIKVMLQSQKHSALPRRVFVCTTIFQKKRKMEANCTSIEKKKSKYLQTVPGESWRKHLYIKLHFLQITIDIQK